MGSIYTHITNNKRQTIIFVMLFILFISFIGWFFGEIFAGDGFFFLGFALIFSGISSFISYYYSDQIVLRIVGAREVTYEESPDLHKLVENMSIASGLPKPKVYMTEDSALNAFATGRDPEHSVICFTRGIVEKLEKRELEGVVAHEMAHIGNYDIRLMSIVSVLVGTVAIMADWFLRGALWGGDRRGKSSGQLGVLLIILGLLVMILSPFIATIIKLALSRNREYLADSTAAMITRFPDGLANALEKIAKDNAPMPSASSATAHMYIANPFKKEAFSNLFNTHPPVEDRIKRLRDM